MVDLIDLISKIWKVILCVSIWNNTEARVINMTYWFSGMRAIYRNVLCTEVGGPHLLFKIIDSEVKLCGFHF